MKANKLVDLFGDTVVEKVTEVTGSERVRK